MTHRYLQVIDKVNSSLDPRAVIERIGFHPEGLIDIGNSLRCFCPIHRSNEFKSLQIEKDANTCQCVMKGCPAHEEGNLVTLYAMAAEKDPVSAAVELADVFGIELDRETRESVTAVLRERGREDLMLVANLHIKQGELRQAIAVIDKMIRESPASEELRLKAAQLRQQIGDRDGYARDMEALVRSALNARDTARAREFLQQIVALCPHHLYARETLAELAHRDGDSENEIDNLFIAIEALEELELFERAAECLDKIARTISEDSRFFERYARKLADLGRSTEAADLYIQIGRRALETSALDHALKAFGELLELVPTDSPRFESVYTILRDAGLDSLVLTIRRSQARALLQYGEFDEAFVITRELLASHPDARDVHALHVDVLLQMQDEDKLLPAALEEFDRSLDTPLAPRAEELLRQVHALFPQRHDVTRRLATYLVEKQRAPEALPLLSVLAADSSLPIDERREAAAQAAAISSDDPLVIAMQAAILEEEGQAARAGAEYTKAATIYLAEKRNSEAAEPLNRAWRILGPSPQLYQLMIRFCLNVGDNATAAENITAYLAYLLEQGMTAELSNAVDYINDETEMDPAFLVRLSAELESAGDANNAALIAKRSARIYSEDGDWDLAVDSIRKAIDLGLKSYETYRLCADALLFLGDKDEIPYMLSSAARLAVKDGLLAEASDCYEGIRHCRSLEPQEFVQLYQLYTTQRRTGEALAIFFDFLAAHAQSDDGEFPQALEDIVAGNTDLIQSLDESSKLPEATALLEPLASLEQASPRLRLFLGDLHHALGQDDEAISFWKLASDSAGALDSDTYIAGLERIVNEGKDQFEARHELIDALIVLDETDRARREALQLVEMAIEREAEVHLARGLEVHETLVQDEWSGIYEVVRLLEPSRFVQEIDGIIERFLEGARKSPDPRQMIPAVAYLLEAGNESVELLEEFADLHAMDECIPRATEYYLKSIERLRGLALPGDLIRILRKALRHDPQNVDLISEYLDVLLTTEQPAEALEFADRLIAAMRESADREKGCATLERLQRAYSGNVEFALRTATAHSESGHPDRAAAVLREFAEHTKDTDQPAARRALEQVLTLLPDSIADLELLIDIIASSDGVQATLDLQVRRLELLSDSLEIEPFASRADSILANLGDAVPVRRRVAELIYNKGNHPQGIARLSMVAGELEGREEFAEAANITCQLIEWEPENLEHLSKLAELEEKQGDTDSALRALRQLLHKTGTRDDAPSLLPILERISRLAPEDASVQRRLAETSLALGDEDAAVGYYQQLARLYELDEQHGDALAVMEKILEIRPEDEDTTEHMAMLLVRLGRHEQAMSVWIRLIEHHQAREDLNTAIDLSLRACDMLPAIPEIRALRIDLFRTSGMLDQFAQETAALATLHLEHESRAEAYSVLSGSCIALIELREFPLVEEILREFPQMLRDDARLLRYRALALEGTNRDEAASGAWQELADLHAKTSNIYEQESTLRRAIALMPRDTTLRRRLIKVLRTNESEKIAELLLEYRELAHLLEVDQPRESIELYREILEIDDENIEVLHRLSSLLESHGAAEEACDAYMRLGNACMGFGQNELAETAFSKVMEFSPGDLAALRMLLTLAERAVDHVRFRTRALDLARILEENGEWSQAIDVLKQLAARDPKDADSRLQIADISTRHEDPDHAIGALKEVLEIYEREHRDADVIETLLRLGQLSPADPFLEERLGRTRRRLGQKTEAAAHFCQAAELYQKRGRTEFATEMAEEAVNLGEHQAPIIARAASVLRDVGASSRAAVAFLRLADHFHEAKNLEEELAALVEAGAIHDSDDLQVRMAHLLEQMDRIDDAAACWLALSEHRQEYGDFTETATAINEARRISPNSQAVLERHAQFHVFRRDSAEAVPALRRLADLHQSRAEREQALECLKQILEFESDAATLMRVGRLCRELDRKSEAAEFLVKAAAAAGDHSDTRIAREALYESVRLKPTDTELLRKAGKQLIETGDVEGATNVYRVGIEHLLREAEIDKAQRLYGQALEILPDPLVLRHAVALMYEEVDIPELAAREHTQIATIYQGTGRSRDAIRAIDKALELKPKDLAATERKFALLTEGGMDKEADEVGNQLVSVYLARDERQRALDILEQVIALRPKDTAPRLRLVKILETEGPENLYARHLRALADLYLELDDLQNAVTHLKALLLITPGDTRIRKLYIDTYRQIGSENDLVEDYSKLAEAHARLERFDEAEDAFERALALNDSCIPVLDRYLRYLGDRGQPDQVNKIGIRIARLHLDEGHPRNAMDVLEAIEATADGLPEYHEVKGLAHRELKSPGVAAVSLRRAADIYTAKKQAAKAIDIYAAMVKLDPLNLEVRQKLVEALKLDKRLAEANAARDELATAYAERGLYDLAIRELKEILAADPERPATWERLFEVHRHVAADLELIPDFLEYGDLLARQGKAGDAVDYYLKVVDLDPRNLRAHRGYISQYPKMGKILDIVDDILGFSQLLIEEGEVDEAIRYFELVMSVDPQNTVARDMLSATQARSSSKVPWLTDEEYTPRKEESSDAATQLLESSDETQMVSEDIDISDTQNRLINESQEASDFVKTAAEYLKGALDDIEHDETIGALKQIEQNYRDILSVNPQNGGVRIKLAEVLLQMGRTTETLIELDQASDIFFNKGDLRQCIAACERYLAIKTADQKIRRRLNEAILKQDAFKALESAILFSDETERDPTSRSDRTTSN